MVSLAFHYVPVLFLSTSDLPAPITPPLEKRLAQAALLKKRRKTGVFPGPFGLDLINHQRVHDQETLSLLTSLPIAAYRVRQVSTTVGRAMETAATAADSTADRAVGERRPSKQRSRVTNGKTLFVEADQRGPWARRWKDVLGEIVSDLGGIDLLSEGQKQLARRCATIAIACERMEGEAALGNEIDLDAYGTLTDRLGRTLG